MDVSKYIGIPFKEKGRDSRGFDCWGLVRYIYKMELGVDLPSYTDDYETTEDSKIIGNKIISESERHWHKVNQCDIKPFDVVIMSMRGEPMHVGLVVDKRNMIHIIGGGSSISKCLRLDSFSIKSKIVGFRRHASLL